ncbi:LOW QUALITY PROTEIN: DNA transposase THAP9 [Rhineura floridana]|uniref:LOW QUALITY PROTEIN: DNA transposase THAP9 n=1 Tax=Rhineura floridana TaxID=261503 RepID=UPI002AC87358|nr:LOW QUALITY PROTEIN: DNA transposase THAP9 [Rhineura floridana]
MPKACSAVNCPNRDTRENRAKGLSFHSFPKAHELRKKWMLAVNRIEPGSRKLWIPGSGACLCSEHFSQDEFEMYGGQKRLKAGVIPSVFSFKEPTKGQYPSKSLKAMGNGRPATGISEAVSPADPTTAQAKAVELIQAEHQYSLSEAMDTRIKSFAPPGPVQGTEREQDAAQRRLSYYQQELWSVLESLREQYLLQKDAEQTLRSQFSDVQLSLQCEGAQCESYPPATRNFAVSLHLFSAKAYEFMKRTFQLPEPTTLRTWLSNLDYKPGFSQQAFNALAERSQAREQAFKLCSLLIGTIPLERKIHCDPSTRSLHGLVDFGAGNYDADEVLAAGEALLFVAVGFQGQWILPLGYFLLATLRGDIQAQLLCHCILKLYDIGVQVISVTSDATAPNIDTARQLGVVVDGLSVKSTFFHPATPTLKIAYYFDPSHLVSLIHNVLQADGSLQVSGKAVCWDYLLHLGALREEEVMQAASQAGAISPLEQRVWGNGTTQLFSEGTVQALHFAAQLGLPQFQGHETTSYFIGLLSAVFDACSSWNVYGKGFKAPLSLTGVDALNNLCNEYENLLRKLRTATGELLGLSRHQWGFLGFLVNLRSSQWLVQTYLQAEDKPIACLLSCWWNLDPLEWCKGAIRQACGHTGIGTAWTFQRAYRLVLKRALSGLGLDPPNLLDISLCRRTSLQLQASWPLGQGQIWQLHWDAQLPQETNGIAPAFLAELEEDTVTYISCVVLGKLLPLLPCAECRAALLCPCEGVPTGSALICVESKGGKYRPAKSVRRVIHRAKQVVGLSSLFLRDSSHHGCLAQELAILADVSEEPGLFSSLVNHLFESNALVSNHYVTLLQELVRAFLALWLEVVQGPQSMSLTEGHSSLRRWVASSAQGMQTAPAGNGPSKCSDSWNGTNLFEGGEKQSIDVYLA